MSKNKFYVVWKGRETGVFTSWPEVNESIKGFSGAEYKGYADQETAELEFSLGSPKGRSNDQSHTTPQIKEESSSAPNAPDYECLTVDGSYLGKKKIMQYRCVWSQSKEEVFSSKPIEGGNQNIAEFLALVGAMKYRVSTKQYDLHIYSDSQTALSWVRNCKIKSSYDLSKLDEVVQDRVHRALKFIIKSDVRQNLYKWDSALWGDIPADYGRK
ncbi:ribonuclease H family protein [Vibrio vulnificus]|nr:ribonuclease H family protein [Vibrio vulnificus]